MSEINCTIAYFCNLDLSLLSWIGAFISSCTTCILLNFISREATSRIVPPLLLSTSQRRSGPTTISGLDPWLS